MDTTNSDAITENNDDNEAISKPEEELEKLKNDCATLTRKLKELKDEEKLLAAQNDILAREIIDLGYTKYNKAE